MRLHSNCRHDISRKVSSKLWWRGRLSFPFLSAFLPSSVWFLWLFRSSLQDWKKIKHDLINKSSMTFLKKYFFLGKSAKKCKKGKKSHLSPRQEKQNCFFLSFREKKKSLFLTFPNCFEKVGKSDFPEKTRKRTFFRPRRTYVDFCSRLQA